MASQWQTTAQASAAQATATVTSGTTGSTVIRLRNLLFSISGTGAGSITCVVRDGATGTGTIIWQSSLNSAANASAFIGLNGLDLRATSGSLTIETTATGGANTTTSIDAGGDFIFAGSPYMNP